MPKYRVTYVDSVLREAVVESASSAAAEEIVRAQMENAQHHHACDAWNDDWSVEACRRPPFVNRSCFECGENRE